MSHRDLLAGIAIFVNGAKGHSALQLSRDLNCEYKTTFVLAHKLRDAIGAGDKGAKVSGEVEIDGMYTGGQIRPANYKKDRKIRRRADLQTGERRVVLVARVMAERGLNTSDKQLVKSVSLRVGASLRHNRSKGLVRSAGGIGIRLAREIPT